jgi:hypothetical protein
MRFCQTSGSVIAAVGGIAALVATCDADAALPTLAQCSAPDYGLYIAGSPAAQSAFATTIAADLFGGSDNLATYTATNGNFKAYCGFASSSNSAAIPQSSVVTIHYRAEGDNFVGTMLLATGNPIKFLDLTQSSQITGFDVQVTGSSAANDPDDSWTGALAPHAVEVGISDLDLWAILGTNEYPTQYNTTVYGSPTLEQFWMINSFPIFQQVFGVFVNTSGINGDGSGQAIGLSSQVLSNIFIGQYTDWHQVPSTTGGPVSNVSAPINLINQAPGAGARYAAELYFLGAGCTPSSPYLLSPYLIDDLSPDTYSTSSALSVANATPGSITYATIENVGAMPNLTLASLDGIAPSAFTAVTGQYGWWYEATLQVGTITSPGGSVLANWLVNELATAATAPHSSQVMAIPNLGNPQNPFPLPNATDTFNGQTIYTNVYSRGGNNCTSPVGYNW